jgi:hypothetical protein
MVARAKTESWLLLTEIRRAVNVEWDRLKADGKTRDSLAESRKRLILAARGADSAPEPADFGRRPAAAGDRVEVPHLGLKGCADCGRRDSNGAGRGAVTVKVPAQACEWWDARTPPSPWPSPGRGERVTTPLPSGEGRVRKQRCQWRVASDRTHHG